MHVEMPDLIVCKLPQVYQLSEVAAIEAFQQLDVLEIEVHARFVFPCFVNFVHLQCLTICASGITYALEAWVSAHLPDTEVIVKSNPEFDDKSVSNADIHGM